MADSEDRRKRKEDIVSSQEQRRDLSDDSMSRRDKRKGVMLGSTPLRSAPPRRPPPPPPRKDPEPESLVIDESSIPPEVPRVELVEEAPPPRVLTPEERLRKISDDLVRGSLSLQRLAGNQGRDIDGAEPLDRILADREMDPLVKQTIQKMSEVIPHSKKFSAGPAKTKKISPEETLMRTGETVNGKKLEKLSLVDSDGTVLMKPGASDDPRLLKMLGQAYGTVLGDETPERELNQRGASLIGAQDATKASKVIQDLNAHVLTIMRGMGMEQRQNLDGMLNSGYETLTRGANPETVEKTKSALESVNKLSTRPRSRDISGM